MLDQENLTDLLFLGKNSTCVISLQDRTATISIIQVFICLKISSGKLQDAKSHDLRQWSWCQQISIPTGPRLKLNPKRVDFPELSTANRPYSPQGPQQKFTFHSFFLSSATEAAAPAPYFGVVSIRRPCRCTMGDLDMGILLSPEKNRGFKR